MGEPFIGEIRIFTYNFAPRNWAYCDGSILNINQHSSLYAVIGNSFGGDGRTTFQLPNFKGRAPLHQNKDGGSTHMLGEYGGTDYIQLTPHQIPSHNHRLRGTTDDGNTKLADDNHMLAKSRKGGRGSASVNAYSSVVDPDKKVEMHPRALREIGSSQSHDNRQPSLVLNFCIALEGLFPPRPSE